ncbi:AlpA family phage regulatory protein [Colwellia sp. MB3u-70]|jgi:prophage regulatory protein|uniref:helix-turn-helix transcriptional regulator n=1 Tax=unclassified Colwellia TaxID=196834 RepID=UPI0015F584FD|nr:MULTISPECIES: AlpA family phage regulatory protein [unclassified Colwellia]MBA6291621.1 AlpA family phage regulatory protein [Colwellia sp. MB3u-8]MBA6309200.1 AlpA family phage regulatory protein [Colwellia sp. MB3u-70]
MNTYQVKQQPRILRRPEVLELTGWSKSTLYNRIEAQHFIKPISLGLRSIGFVSSEVNAVLNAMIQEKSPEQIKQLVQELINQRTKAA